MTAIKYREITLPGLTGELRAVESGDPRGRPLLALHGWLDNAASFAPLAPYLQDYRLVALDFPGHGQSAHRPSGGLYHLVDYVMDVARAVEALDWGPFILMGHSLGAGVSTLYAASRVGAVEKMVLIDGIGPLAGDIRQAPVRLGQSIELTLGARDRPPARFPDWQALIQARCRAGDLARESAERLVRRAAEEQDGEVVLVSDRRLKQPSPIYLSENQVREYIRAVRVPARLILAEQGEIVVRKETAGRIADFAGLDVVRVNGGHHLHMDHAEAVAAPVREFLDAEPG